MLADESGSSSQRAQPDRSRYISKVGGGSGRRNPKLPRHFRPTILLPLLYLTLQNPTNSDETVAVTMFANTYVIEQQVVVKAHSRSTLNINSLIVPIAQAHDNGGANAYAVSLIAQVFGNGSTIVVERPMYFNFYGDQGGTDVIGYTG